MSVFILTSGPTHSGKTTFGRELQRRLGEKVKFVHVDNDVVDEFVNANYTQLRNDKEVLERRTPSDPDLRLLIPRLVTDYALREDYSVIATASHPWRVIRQDYYKIAQKHGAKIVLLVFHLDEDEARERIEASSRDADILSTAPHNAETFRQLYENQKKLIEKPTGDERQQCYRVLEISPDTFGNVLEEVSEILESEYE